MHQQCGAFKVRLINSRSSKDATLCELPSKKSLSSSVDMVGLGRRVLGRGRAGGADDPE